MKLGNLTVNEGTQETSGTSQKDKYVSEKQKQLLTVRLQNLHITEYKGKSFQVFSTMRRFP